MRCWMVAAILSAQLLGATAVAAQEGEEIIVTASRRESDDYVETMPITRLRRTADFAVQSVRIAGDTRDAEQRRSEIYEMVRQAIATAGKLGVELATGEYLVEPLTPANYRALTLTSDGRPDTDRTEFLVKVRLQSGMDAKAAIDRITRFVAAVPAVGRAEIKESGDLTLSVVNPDQYRGQIVDLIAADAAATAGKFGAGYGVEVKGLDRPVEWSRASLTDVFLYLPANYVVRPRS